MNMNMAYTELVKTHIQSTDQWLSEPGVKEEGGKSLSIV